MRDELFQQVFGELREFVLELELDSCCEERGSLEQPADQRIDTVIQNAAEALRNTWIFFSELARMLVEQLKFGVVQIEKFPIHARSQSIDDNFSGFDNIGDKLDRNLQRVAHQFATDHEAYLQFDGVELFVTLDTQRIRRNSPFIVDDCGSNLFGNLVHPILVHGPS